MREVECTYVGHAFRAFTYLSCLVSSLPSSPFDTGLLGRAPLLFSISHTSLDRSYGVGSHEAQHSRAVQLHVLKQRYRRRTMTPR